MRAVMSAHREKIIKAFEEDTFQVGKEGWKVDNLAIEQCGVVG